MRTSKYFCCKCKKKFQLAPRPQKNDIKQYGVLDVIIRIGHSYQYPELELNYGEFCWDCLNKMINKIRNF